MMKIHYLEIVTPEVKSTCAIYTQKHDVSFSDPVSELGGAHTAYLAQGGMIGIRTPMHESESPVVRPYFLVDDIEAAVSKAESAGADIIHPPLEIPGYGKFAIYALGGIQHGLWQV